MKNDFIVSTLPIKPQISTNIGMMIAPTIMQYIGNVFDIEKCMSVNLLHTYSNKKNELQNYINYILQAGITYNMLFRDDMHNNQLIGFIIELLKNDILDVEKRHVIYCECGKIDMLKEAVNENGKLYHKVHDKIICNCCNNICKECEEDVLVMKIKEHENPLIAPTFLEKELLNIKNQFIGKKLLISKHRNTGFNISVDNRKFNIDIDFIWSNYFKILEPNNQIFIASNHQIYNMFLINYLSKVSTNKKLYFIATPYINGNLAEMKKQYELKNLKEYKMLLLLYNLKWKNKNSNWSDSNFNYLSNISDTKIKNLYEAFLCNDYSFDIFSNIDKALNESSNMQKNIQKMKKLYKERHYER